MKPVRVIVNGALGRMGQEVISALYHEPETQPVGAVELKASPNHLELPDGSVPYPSPLTWNTSFTLPSLK